MSRFLRTAMPQLRAAVSIFTFAVLMLGLARAASARVYYVASAGSGNGLSWATAGALQPVLSVAHAGDQVWVKAGTYFDNFTATDGVAVYGGFAGTETSISQRKIATNPSILDDNYLGTAYTIPTSATHANTLDGFTVQHATNSGLIDFSRTPLNIANCVFTNNSADTGGGIYVLGPSMSISKCTFASNSASTGRGGGIESSDGTTTLQGCTFLDNVAVDGGGGIDDVGDTALTMSSCVFTDNTTTFTGNDEGGGVTAYQITIAISGCTFSGNSSNSGGGVEAYAAFITIDGCSFTDNSAYGGYAGYGGGLNVSGIATISDCAFTRNGADYGGGIASSGEDVTINSCTFVGNEAANNGGGIDSDSTTTTTIADCILKGNGALAIGGGINAYNTTPTISRCIFGGSSPNDANNPEAIAMDYVGDYNVSAVVKDCLFTGGGSGSSNLDGIDLDKAGYPQSNASFVGNSFTGLSVPISVATKSGSVRIANNIFTDSVNGLVVTDTTGPLFTLSHNDFYGNNSNYSGIAPGSTDLFDDPQSNVPGDGDYRLRRTSPLIDAGDDSYVSLGDLDLFGNPRINGSHVDIGAYEYYAASSVVSFSPASGPAGTVITITGTNLSAVSLVGFLGQHAKSFTVNAAGTQITTTVPVGAQTGPIAILAPGGEYKSTTAFTVTR